MWKALECRSNSFGKINPSVYLCIYRTGFNWRHQPHTQNLTNWQLNYWSCRVTPGMPLSWQLLTRQESSELSDFKPYFKCSNTFENVPTRARLRMRRIFQMHKFLIRSAIKLYGWSDKKLMGTFLWNEVMLSFSIPFANTVYILYFPPHTEINQNTTRQMVELKRQMEISSRTDLRSFFSNLCYF